MADNLGGREYTHGTNVVTTSEPSEGWEFDSWDGDLSGNG
ncbi:InlB B-repeat-containing protein [Echinicola arenosa]